MSHSIRDQASRPLRAFLWLALVAGVCLIATTTSLRIQAEKNTMKLLLVGFIQKVATNADFEGNTLFFQREIQQLVASLAEAGIAKIGIAIKLDNRLIAFEGNSDDLLFAIKVDTKAILSSGRVLESSAVIDGASLLWRYVALQTLTLLSLLVIFLLAQRRIFLALEQIAGPIERLCLVLKSGDGYRRTVEFDELKRGGIEEVSELVASFESFIFRFEEDQKKIAELRQSEAIALITKQVAHDIRSPLSALNMVVAANMGIQGDSRLLLQRSINRINAIADDLLKKSKDGNESSALVLIKEVIEMIVDEKRMQANLVGIQILTMLDSTDNLRARISSTELARALSNLLNNAVEAMPKNGGIINIGLQALNMRCEITIEDNGKGIPPDVLEKLDKSRLSFGKSGNGLGVAHARELASKAGGNLSISSQIGLGTKISLILPTGLEGRETDEV